jgi:hypothetical protein
MMQHQAVLQPHACQCDLKICVREFLQIMCAGQQRIVIGLNHVLRQHRQNDLGIFGIILVPRPETGLAHSRQGQRRDAYYRNAF